MIWLENNVPNTYVNQSRDFQLFCRLYDCIVNGVKFDIDSMIYLYDPIKVNNRLLNLLASKVGFFPKRDLNTMMLRSIISSFPYLVKYKGSRKAVESAVATVLKADNVFANYSIIISNDEHSIQIAVDQPYDKIALAELLEYIVPIGYTFSLIEANSITFTTELDLVNIIQTYLDPSESVSQVITGQSKDWEMPSYSINKKRITESQIGIPSKTITIDKKTNESVIVYKYYEYDDEVPYEKVMTVRVPNNDTNRYIGTLNRTEVIGSKYDKSDYNSTDDINPRDNDKYKDTISSLKSFNDIGEQNDNYIETFLIRELKEGESLSEYAALILPPHGQSTVIPIEDIIIPNGSSIVASNISLGIAGTRVKDINGSIAKVDSVNETTVTVTTQVYLAVEGDN